MVSLGALSQAGVKNWFLTAQEQNSTNQQYQSTTEAIMEDQQHSWVSILYLPGVS